MSEPIAIPEFTTRKLYPARRYALDEWEISVGGRVVGWVRETRVGRNSTAFFKAVGILPDGKHLSLELSTDFDERCRTVAEFSVAPERYAQHLPGRYRVPNVGGRG